MNTNLIVMPARHKKLTIAATVLDEGNEGVVWLVVGDGSADICEVTLHMRSLFRAQRLASAINNAMGEST